MSHAIYNMEETYLSLPFLYWGIYLKHTSVAFWFMYIACGIITSQANWDTSPHLVNISCVYGSSAALLTVCLSEFSWGREAVLVCVSQFLKTEEYPD